MRISRLYIEQALMPEDTVSLPRDKAHYITNVLRMKAGDSIILFNDSGNTFDATILELTRKSARIKITSSSEDNRESPLKVILALAISRGQHMDYALQKAVELGVHKIVPLQTEFSNVKLQDDRIQNKLSHWQNIIISATEQCGRNRLAKLSKPVAFNEWLTAETPATCVIMQPGSTLSMKDVEPINNELALLIGPEGGFSENELDLAAHKGCISVNFGPRILRAETAVVSGVSVAQQLWGDLK